VIETSGRGLVKPLGAVAAGARGAEPALVRIGVAVAAFLMRKRLEERDRLSGGVERKVQPGGLMTYGAGDVRVLPRERVRGHRVIEIARRLPLARVVAAGAVRAKGSAMNILVARPALALEADPRGPLFRAVRAEARRPGDLELRLMAIPALKGGVLALQRPAGAGMIELHGRASLPSDQVEVRAGVIGMAGGARTKTGLAVKPAMGVSKPGDLRVALEALPLHRDVGDAMARNAVKSPFHR